MHFYVLATLLLAGPAWAGLPVAYDAVYKTVKKNPQLVLENLNELCWSCHKIGDCLRETLKLKLDKLWMVVKVALLMPEEMKEKLDWVARAWLEKRKNDKVKKLNDYFNSNP